MELLTYSKNDYLLDASLDTLHAESKDWLNELEFLNDEMAFFYKLLHKKDSKKEFPPAELAILEKELIRISSEELERVKGGILSHERLLSALIKSASMAEEQVYREAHRRLHDELYQLYALIRVFKRKVYSFYHTV